MERENVSVPNLYQIEMFCKPGLTFASCNFTPDEKLVFLFFSRHTTPEKFFIEACDEGADAVLAIDRVSNEMTLTGRKSLKTKQLLHN